MWRPARGEAGAEDMDGWGGRGGRGGGSSLLYIAGNGSGGEGRGQSGHSRGRKEGRFPSAAGNFGRRLAGFRPAVRWGRAAGGSLRGVRGDLRLRGAKKPHVGPRTRESRRPTWGGSGGVCAARGGLRPPGGGAPRGRTVWRAGRGLVVEHHGHEEHEHVLVVLLFGGHDDAGARGVGELHDDLFALEVVEQFHE